MSNSDCMFYIPETPLGRVQRDYASMPNFKAPLHLKHGVYVMHLLHMYVITYPYPNANSVVANPRQ